MSAPPSDLQSPPPVPGILITKYTNPVPERDQALLYAFSVLVFSLTFMFWAYTIWRDKRHRTKMTKLATTEAIMTGNIHDYDMLRIPPLREERVRLGGGSPGSGNSNRSSPHTSQSDLESHPSNIGGSKRSALLGKVGITSNSY